VTAVNACVDWRGAGRAREGLELVAAGAEGGRSVDERFVAFSGPAATLSDVQLVADARIDNAVELRAALGDDGGEDLGRTLIRAYLRWGVSFADRLLGDFAVVLWDARKQTLVAARDPFGVRPLFVAAREDRLWLSSQVAPLLATRPPGSGLEADLDDEAVLQHLLWCYRTPSPSFYRSIRDVPAGHVLVATPAGQRHERYWRPPTPRAELERAGREEVFEELRTLFRRAVARRLSSPGPVVVHVSGGLDSSSIAMAANELVVAARAPRVIGASAIFPGMVCDESQYIDAVAGAVAFPIERWDATRPDPLDLTAPALEGPGARSSSTSGTSGDLETAVRHGARTILSGLGGDDLMTVSGITRDLVVAGRWGDAWASLSAQGFSSPAARQRLRKIAAQFLPRTLARLRARARARVPEWVSPRFRSLAREILSDDGGDSQPALTSLVRRNAWTLVNAAHPKIGVARLQALGLAKGIEFRFPFLDRELVSFVLGLPSHALPGPVPTARVHREAFRPMLPRAVADRVGKADLTAAVENRVRRALPQIEALFDGGSWASHRFVDREAAHRALRAVTSGPAAASGRDWWRVWRIAAVEAWTRSILLYGMRQ
jgi:asparagine synthase (glutamine-hydrolysing)